MSGVSIPSTSTPKRVWEVTEADDSDLSKALSSLVLPKPLVKIIEVSSIEQVGAALVLLQSSPELEVELQFTPEGPHAVFDFAFNLPQAMPDAIARYNSILDQIRVGPNTPSYGVQPGARLASIHPTERVDLTLNKKVVVDLSSVNHSSAGVAAANVVGMLERVSECHDNPPRFEVEMPRDAEVTKQVQEEIVRALSESARCPKNEVSRRVYLRKRLELLDLIFQSWCIPGDSLIDFN